LHVCDVFSAKRSIVSCQLSRQAGGSHRATFTPTSPTLDEIKLCTNNHGEAHGKTLPTMGAFRSKHTKRDIISDGPLPYFG
jgi:hypothetical protein